MCQAGPGDVTPVFIDVDSDLFLDTDDNLVLYAASFSAAPSLVVLVLGYRCGGDLPPYPPGPRGAPVWKGFSTITQKYRSSC